MSRPAVSIIVIAHNERRHVGQTVRSILEQDAQSFELLVVDDGSTDGTSEEAQLTARNDGRFRLVRLATNEGRGAARAAGVAAASGDAVAFVDADITLPKDWLRRCLTALPGNAAVGGVAVPDGDVAVVARMSSAQPRRRAGSMPITGNNVVFDRTAFEHTGFDPRDRLGEDFKLANRLVRAGHSLRRVPDLWVEHEEAKTLGQAIRWRFQNGVDAAGHPRELGRLRFADAVWLGWVVVWIVGGALALAASPMWLFIGPFATGGAAVAHVASRFHLRPVGPFLLACLIDVPLMGAYLLGRTIGLPNLVRGR